MLSRPAAPWRGPEGNRRRIAAARILSYFDRVPQMFPVRGSAFVPFADILVLHEERSNADARAAQLALKG